MGGSGLEKARAEIAAIKPRFITSRGWMVRVVEHDGVIDLLVGMHHVHHPDRRYLLQLRCTNEFPQRRPEEAFLNPEEPHEPGVAFWPREEGVPSGMAFHVQRTPPRICIPGTYGFHAEIHANERDPLQTTIQNTLLMIQGRINEIP